MTESQKFDGVLLKAVRKRSSDSVDSLLAAALDWTQVDRKGTLKLKSCLPSLVFLTLNSEYIESGL